MYTDDELLKVAVNLTAEDFDKIVRCSSFISNVSSGTSRLFAFENDQSEQTPNVLRQAIVNWIEIAMANGTMHEIQKKFLQDLLAKQDKIPEYFCDEAEDTIKMMADVQARLNKCSEAESVVLQKAYNELYFSLMHLIMGE